MHVAINAWFWDNPSVGSGQYLRYLLPALLEADPNLDITLVSCKPLDGVADCFPRVQPFVARTVLPNQQSNLAKVWFEQITFPRVCRYLQVDVAHVPYFGSPLYPTDPTVVTVHDLIPMVVPQYRGALPVRMYTALVGAAARQANLVMTDSEASRVDVLKRLSMSPEVVRTVYLAQAPQFAPSTDTAAVRQTYQLPEKFILYLGGYDVRKNLPHLLKAYAQLEEPLRRAYPLVLAGKLPSNNTPFFPDPRSVAQQLNLEGNLITPGWIAEADRPALYAAATLFVYPSLYEGFGLPVLESMACGTPVITTTAASLPELAGQAARLVPPTDVAQLTHALRDLCQQPELRAKLAQTGVQQASRFDWHKTALQTLQTYHDVLRDTVD